MMDRAYSLIETKGFDDKKRTFTGVASAISPDRMGDVVDPKGAKFKLPMPFLWQHDSKNPIGWVTAARVTDKNIEVDVEIASVTEPGQLKDRLDEYWQMLKSKLVRGLSIGFNALEYSRIESGLHYLAWEWLELSAVTIAAHQQANITTIKSLDTKLRAASGQTQRGVTSLPASRGNTKGTTVKTLKELKEAHETKSARQSELLELRKSESGRKFTPAEAEEFDALSADADELEDEIRIKSFEERMASKATPARGSNANEGSQSRSGVSFVKKTDPEPIFKGEFFIRQQVAKALSFIELKNGNFVPPAVIAKQRWGQTHPQFVEFMQQKAAVPGGGTGSGEWGADLALSDTRYAGDFIEYLYGMTVFDRLPLRPVPARVHIRGQDGASTAYWVGESKAIPVTTLGTSDVELTPLKVAATAVCSKDLIEDSSPSAMLLIRDSIAEASAQRVDQTFLSATAASAGVSPAGILNGLSALAPSGADAAAIRNDILSLYSGFLTAKNAANLVLIMTPSLAKAISLMVNALGQTEFVGLNAGGGTLLGDTVYTGDNVTPGDIILMRPSDVWKIGDSGIQMSMTDTATVEMNDAPAGASDTPVAMASHTVSLWQTESVGFKVVRRINFAIRRAGAVAVLSNAEYGGVVS